MLDPKAYEKLTTADERMVRWLFEESGVSRYKIAKEVGLSEASLSRMARDITPLKVVKFGHAQRLTAYAVKLKALQEQEGLVDGEK